MLIFSRMGWRGQWTRSQAIGIRYAKICSIRIQLSGPPTGPHFFNNQPISSFLQLQIRYTQ